MFIHRADHFKLPEKARECLKQPLVSIVVPVYNGERYLAAALESIHAQEYRTFEIVIMDDGSTDRSAEIVKAFAQVCAQVCAQTCDAVRYMYQRNQGVASAWNAGVAAANGELIAFLAQDDLWTPTKLGTQVEYMVSHPHIQYTVAKARYFLEPGCSIPSGLKEELLDRDHVARIVETMVARRSVFDMIGGFNTDLATSQDVEWFARAKDLDVPMAVIPKVLLHRRIHDHNLTYRVQPSINKNLLRIMRQSVERQRGRRSSDHGGDR